MRSKLTFTFTVTVVVLCLSAVLLSQGKKKSTDNSSTADTQSQGDGSAKQTQGGDKSTKSGNDKSGGNSGPAASDKGGSADQSPLESQILAFRALRKDAQNIYERVNSALPKKKDIPTKPDIGSLIIFDTSQYATIPTYRAFQAQFGVLVQGYCGALRQSTGTATRPGGHFGITMSPKDILDTIQAANSTLSGILDTLKTTTDLSVQAFTVQDDALVAEVTNLFKSLGVGGSKENAVEVFYPGIYPFSFQKDAIPTDPAPTSLNDACALASSPTLIRRLFAVLFLRAAADAEATALQERNGELDKGIDELGKKKPSSDAERAAMQRQIENANKEKAQNTNLSQRLQGLNKAADGFIAALTKSDENGAAPLLNNLISGERLAIALDSPGAYTLELKIQKSGGESIKKSNLFYGTRFYYGGGSIVSFFLFDTRGAVMSSGNFWSATTYVRDKRMKTLTE